MSDAMMVPIVSRYAAGFALFYILLAVRVIRSRNRNRVALGSGSSDDLRRAIRAHANFAEYVPFALLLLAFAEIRGAWPVLLHVLCIGLAVGRMIHAYGLSQPKEDFRFRVTGMALTLTAIGLAALLLFTL